MYCVTETQASDVATPNSTTENTNSLQSNSFTNNIKSAMSVKCLHLDWLYLAILCNQDYDLVAH